MREIAIELIKQLNITSSYLSSSDLSNFLGISKRTVKNIVVEINNEVEGLIISSSKGYSLNHDQLTHMKMVSQTKNTPQTPSERMFFILKKLLLENITADNPLDLYDISDDLKVSEATIQKDLFKVRKYLKNYEISVNSSAGMIYTSGQESDKRRVLNVLYYQEIENGEVSITTIKELFPAYDVEKISEIILAVTRKYHYFINHFSLLNVVLYVIISINRVKENFLFEETEYSKLTKKKIFDNEEKKMIKEISGEFEDLYQFSYNPLELEELGTILIGNILVSDLRDIGERKLLRLVGKDTVSLVENMILAVKEYYGSLEVNQDFLTRFSLHVNNLLTRLKVNYNNKNPLADRIKYSYPLLFDSAVKMANILYKREGYQVSDDEIALMALHLGTLFDETEKEKLNAVVIIPDYHDIFSKLVDKIENRFPTLVLKKIAPKDVENTSANYFEQLDMVITTIPLDNNQINAVYVSPLFNDHDASEIARSIHTIQNEKRRRHLRKILSDITHPSFFKKNDGIRSQQDILLDLCKTFEKEHIVPNTFTDDVEKREQLSSTAFGKIAVPHALSMDANQTMLSISIYDKPILWGENEVQIIFLFAIDKNKKKPFNDVFDNLIINLSDKEDLNELIKSKDYETFLENLLNAMENGQS